MKQETEKRMRLVLKGLVVYSKKEFIDVFQDAFQEIFDEGWDKGYEEGYNEGYSNAQDDNKRVL